MPSSFKTIEFNEIESSTTFGRRLVNHEFPFQDKSFTEDLGKKTRVYNIQAYVIGVDWESKRDQLIAACEAGDPGVLKHPDFGEIEVYCESISTTESKITANKRCDFEFKFFESGDTKYPKSNVDTKEKLRLSTQNEMTLLITVFKQTYDITKQPDFIKKTISKITTTMGDLLLNSKSDILQKLGLDISNVDVTNTLALASVIQDIFNNESDDLTLGKVIDILEPEITVQTTSHRIIEAKQQDILINTLTNLSILTKVRAVTNIEFKSYDEAITKRDEILKEIGKLPTDNIDIYESISRVKTDLINDINIRAPELSRIIKKRYNNTKPALVIAYDFYKDSARNSEIINRNNIKHPAYVGGAEYLELIDD